MIFDFIVPLYIYYRWFQCLPIIRTFLSTIHKHQHWLIQMHGFQLIRPTSSLFDSQLFQLRRTIFQELHANFLHARHISRQYSRNDDDLICSIDLDEFGPLLQNDSHDIETITHRFDQAAIRSMLKLCQLQINECIQLVHLHRPHRFWQCHHYEQFLHKSIEKLNRSKRHCSLMIDYLPAETRIATKLVPSYFLLRSNCEQLFGMNESNALDQDQLKRIVQDLKTVIYSLEAMQRKPQASSNDERDEQTATNETHASPITSFHRFDDRIEDSIDELLIGETDRTNDDEPANCASTDMDTFDQRLLREQTHCLMKELQTAIQGKKQEWNEREQRLLGNVDRDERMPEENEQEVEEEEENDTFEKLPPMPQSLSMLDELKHTFLLNRQRLNLDEDTFEEETFDDEDEE